MDVFQLIADAIPIIAEDLKDARVRSGITTSRAAKKVGINVARYRRLENGRVPKYRENLDLLISAARSLGLDAVRMSYVDEIQEYMRYDLSETRRFTVFVDSLSHNVSEIKKLGYFVSPYNIFALVDNVGLNTVLECKNSIDQTILELWVTALFSLSLGNHNQVHYVRPVRGTAPDAEILTDDYGSGNLRRIKIEVTQYNRYSDNIYEIIQKKLTKRYDRSTIVLVLVNRREEIHVSDLYDVVQKNNPSLRPIYIIGGAGDDNKFKLIPCNEIRKAPDKTGWLELSINVNTKDIMRYKYDGVVFKVPYMKRVPRVWPVFVKEIRLSR